MTTCQQCPIGKFSTNSGSVDCNLCAGGHYSSVVGATKCVSCPKSSSSFVGSSDISHCSCVEGYYQRNIGTSFECVRCPEATGLRCQGKWANVSAGYYWKQGKLDTFECIPFEACQASVDLNGTQCGSFYHGDNCGECIVGVSHRSGNSCDPCPSSVASTISGIALVCTFFLICYVLSKKMDSVSFGIRIVLLSIQFIASFGSFFARWPPVMSNFLSGLSFTVISFSHH
jgi:hypothetical protein